jgi:transcriptional regulator with PAS, ATPase and Fis domain
MKNIRLSNKFLRLLQQNKTLKENSMHSILVINVSNIQDPAHPAAVNFALLAEMQQPVFKGNGLALSFIAQCDRGQYKGKEFDIVFGHNSADGYDKEKYVRYSSGQDTDQWYANQMKKIAEAAGELNIADEDAMKQAAAQKIYSLIKEYKGRKSAPDTAVNEIVDIAIKQLTRTEAIKQLEKAHKFEVETFEVPLKKRITKFLNENFDSNISTSNDELIQQAVCYASDMIKMKFEPDDGLASEYVGESDSIKQIRFIIRKFADAILPILILGESGSGKEIVAQKLHFYSKRKKQKFVAINCAALAETILESALFGHVKGAYTGASSDRVGLFEEARGGTLFLDEVGEMSPALQSKLLRVLQEGTIQRVGSWETKRVDVRVIAATNRNLIEMVKSGKFRPDTYFRLHVLQINVPSLRERKEDILQLAEHFLDGSNKQLTNGAKEKLKNWDFYGNVRELKSMVDRGIINSTGSYITIQDLDFSLSPILIPVDSSVSETGGGSSRTHEKTVDEKKQLINDLCLCLESLGQNAKWICDKNGNGIVRNVRLVGEDMTNDKKKLFYKKRSKRAEKYDPDSGVIKKQKGDEIEALQNGVTLGKFIERLCNIESLLEKDNAEEKHLSIRYMKELVTNCKVNKSRTINNICTNISDLMNYENFKIFISEKFPKICRCFLRKIE